MTADVPSPIDLRTMDDALAWAGSALSKRPCRTEFFAAFAAAVGAASCARPCRVLELGSGPGFLAEHVMGAHPATQYVALDFSPAMHQLAADRLDALGTSVQFVQRSFLEPDWYASLGRFDVVVTHQAVHELRHKRYAAALHTQVREVLLPHGCYLVCDHFAGEGGMSNDELYMSVAEQKQALQAAGYGSVEQVLCKGGLVLHRAFQRAVAPSECVQL